MKRLFFFLLVIAATTAGWFARDRFALAPHHEHDITTKAAFYQCPMHPWIKSDRPGKCTICGMDLTPIKSGDAGVTTDPHMVILPKSAIQVIGVSTAKAVKQPIERLLRVAGTLEDDTTRHRVLSAYAGGRIEKLFVNYVGAEVREGEALARIYSPDLLNAAREFKLLAGRPANDPLLESTRRRLSRLGLTPEQITALATEPEAQNWIEIRAPMSGTVVSRDVYEGQYIKEGDRLFELADFSTMWFVFDAYEQDLAWLQVGQEVAFTTRTQPGKTWKAPITFIDPNLDDRTRSAKVRVEIKNPVTERDGRRQRELFHRLYAEGSVRLQSPPCLTIPRSAILNPGGSPVVYVDKGSGAYEQREVQIGRRGEELAEVLSGVAEGDSVVLEGNLLIDAQARLNRDATATDTTAPETPAAKPSPLSDQQKSALATFFGFAGEISTALAKDDLAAFNATAPRSHDVLSQLATLSDKPGPLADPVAEVLGAGHLQPSTDIQGARRQLHPFGSAATKLLLAARAQGAAPPQFHAFECPMTGGSYPGAPASGRWIQGTEPLQNPYLGKEMADCGGEVEK